jgi:hypothetical protein
MKIARNSLIASIRQGHDMKQKTLLRFQLCLAAFAFYALLKYPGNSRFLVSLACLVVMFVVAKFETSLTEGKNEEEGQRALIRARFNRLTVC